MQRCMRERQLSELAEFAIIEQQLEITSDHGAVLSNLIPSYSPSRQKMTSAGETFRGRSALILIDGVPQSTPLRDSQRDGYVIDLSMVERIEVIHGASAEHGLGATGGIINYVTRRPASGTLRQHAGVSSFFFVRSLHARIRVR